MVEWSQYFSSILQVLHWFTASPSSECKWCFSCLSYWNCSIKGAWGYHDQPVTNQSELIARLCCTYVYNLYLPILNLSVDELTSWILPDVSDLRQWQCQMNTDWTVLALSRIVVCITYLLYTKCLVQKQCRQHHLQNNHKDKKIWKHRGHPQNILIDAFNFEENLIVLSGMIILKIWCKEARHPKQ